MIAELAEIDALPDTYVQTPIGDGDGEAGSAEGCLGMGGHIVIAFACMLVIRFPFLYEAVEDGFHICLYVRVCILVDGEACACMLDEQMQDSGRRKRWKVAYNLLCHQVKATPARG